MTLNKSIEQLENDYWKDIAFPTGLVERCYRYRRIPIGNLTAEQMRTLISQQLGIKFLMPLVLEMLKKDVLMEADLYEGDLLEVVLKIKAPFWEQNPSIKSQVLHLIEANKQLLVQAGVAKLFNQFLEIHA
ncbi:hypothetical protein SAMN04488055_4423 [Chitinophaga niabensis]|uniref:Uncharacterized protein n=2 Tax=Chitinophaga niabensis TaxID=536979 RepID=A0A1N6JTQ7_9BACT|nr:hypothetical protein SAMN04488055_4423 [Chitinophaga niabensis]